MTTLSTNEFEREIKKLMSLVIRDHEQVVITKDGLEVAALVSIEDLELIRRLEDEADLKAVAEAEAEGLEPTPFEDFCKELGL